MARPYLTHKFVAEAFRKENCELLDTYVNNITPMRYRCSCGNFSMIRYNSFKAGVRCMECGRKKLIKLRTLTYEYVKQFFKDRDCELLSKEYLGNQQILDYRCSCGRIAKIRFGCFNAGSRCKKCFMDRQSKEMSYPIEKYKGLMEARDCHFVSEKDFTRASDSIPIVCNVCGNLYKKTYSNLCKWKGCNHLRQDISTKTKRKFRKLCYSLVERTMKAFGKNKDEQHSYSLLGYTSEELMESIQNHPNWVHVKDTKKWAIDHIFPIDAFVQFNIFNPAIVNGLDNLQPLSKKENSKKGNKYNEKDFLEWLINKGIDIKTYKECTL